jgi:fructose-1,6-bisphosphatase I
MDLNTFLLKHVEDADLVCVLESIFKSIERISSNIDITKKKTENINDSGDQQLEMDVLADVIVHDSLLTCSKVAILASEERADEVTLNGDKFSVAYDPLDGSSLVDANLAIGSIFGVFPGTYLVGRTPKDMVASLFGVYGPRTSVVFTAGKGVFEFVLTENGFELVREDINIESDGKYYAPGNLRAYNSNPTYKRLVDIWLKDSLTLRYSGGMVPDINHIFVKGNGIFAYPSSVESPKGKLRLLYECGPMAFLVEQAGGMAIDGHTRILDLPITDLHQRSPIFVGSENMVKLVEKFVNEA